MRLAVIIDKTLPIGFAANTAAILGMSIGRAVPKSLGPNISDADGGVHPGITNRPVPVLAASPEELRALRARVVGEESVQFADFTDIAQRTRTYDEYTAQLASVKTGEIRYLGLCLYGDDGIVRRLTAGFSLLGRS